MRKDTLTPRDLMKVIEAIPVVGIEPKEMSKPQQKVVKAIKDLVKVTVALPDQVNSPSFLLQKSGYELGKELREIKKGDEVLINNGWFEFFYGNERITSDSFAVFLARRGYAWTTPPMAGGERTIDLEDLSGVFILRGFSEIELTAMNREFQPDGKQMIFRQVAEAGRMEIVFEPQQRTPRWFHRLFKGTLITKQ